MSGERRAFIPESVILAMRGSRASERAVLDVLYLHANVQGEARPSITTIAEYAGIDRSSVCRALDALEQRIGLRRVKPRPGRASSSYYLPTSGCGATSDDGLVGEMHTTSGRGATSLVGGMRPEHVLNIEEHGDDFPSGDPYGPDEESPEERRARIEASKAIRDATRALFQNPPPPRENESGGEEMPAERSEDVAISA